MGPKHFSGFREITDSFRDRSGTALLYESDGALTSLSYPALLAEIERAAAGLRADGLIGTPDLIFPESDPGTVVRIFADVLAGRDLLLAGPSVPRAAAEAVLKKLAAETAPFDSASRVLFFTSGTTSRSRTVILTDRSLAESAYSGQCMLACGEGDVILSMLPLSHVFGFVCGMLWGLAYGAAIALGRGLRHLIDDALYFRPTILPAVPSMIDALIRFDRLNPELRTALIGAAPLSEQSVRLLQEKGTAVYLGYGLTETSSGIAITQDQSDPYALYPCPGADIRVEPDGEVSVATPCMMEGYLGEGFPAPAGIPHAIGDSAQNVPGDGAAPSTPRRFYTGDIGVVDENGILRLTGRKKDILVLSDGTKIFCPEYEADLAKLLGTAELAVCLFRGRPVLVVGEAGGPQGNTQAGRQGDASGSLQALKKRMEHILAEYNRALPRSRQLTDVLCIGRSLPRTPIGKLRRWELQEMLERGEADQSVSQ